MFIYKYIYHEYMNTFKRSNIHKIGILEEKKKMGDGRKCVKKIYPRAFPV